jgi:outer membrane protein assembly factor BamA
MRNNVFLVSLILMIASCTTTHYLHDDEKLYTGAVIKIKSGEKVKNRNKVLTIAKQSLTPVPNKRFLGLRPKLWLYDVAGDSAARGVRKWITTTFGEPPVLLSSVRPGETARNIDADLYNAGYFKSATSFTIKERQKTASVVYECRPGTPYCLKEITYSIQNKPLLDLIVSSGPESLLKPKDPYSLDALKKERVRIDSTFKESGYFYFNPDYLVFKASVNKAENAVNLDLCFKDDIPPRALSPCTIGNVYVDPRYSLQNDSNTAHNDTSIVDDVIFVKKSKIRPAAILRCIFIRKNDVYSRTQHAITLNRLLTMGNFRYVDIKFTEADTLRPGILDVHVLLSPLPKRTIGAEVMLIDKSNDFIGPKLSLNYQERNAMGGAELLNVGLDGSIETQFTGKYKNLYAYQINPQVEVDVPRLLIPFGLINPTGFFIPKTKFSLGYGFLKRIDYFDLKTARFSYGYTWKEDVRKEHELDPVAVNYTLISNKSTRFNALLDSIPFLKKSYEEQFIAGSYYTYTYNEQAALEKKNRFYLKTTGELAGNALWLAEKIYTGKNASSENPQRIAGSIYAQFARFSFDARNYFTFPDKTSLVFRLYGGFGKAFGNSATLPYIRQFFTGGPNSVRAFQINSLGPGTYLQNTRTSSAFLELGGDIKAEANAEYRWTILGLLKGAVFIDAGNDWLLKPDTAINSQTFAVSRFYKELAVGTGFGLRADFSFFVLRFDLAMPLRKPWLAENERWVITAVDFPKYEWRRDNLVLNIAIGYPF